MADGYTKWLSEDERLLAFHPHPVATLLSRLAAERERNAELVEALPTMTRAINEWVHANIKLNWPTIEYYPGFSQLDAVIQPIIDAALAKNRDKWLKDTCDRAWKDEQRR